MIDLLLYTFGPHIAEKFFGGKKADPNLSPEDIKAALLELGKAGYEQKGQIEKIQRELSGLQPQNFNPRFDEIQQWMERHVDSEKRNLKKMLREQEVWNFSLAVALLVVLILSLGELFYILR